MTRKLGKIGENRVISKLIKLIIDFFHDEKYLLITNMLNKKYEVLPMLNFKNKHIKVRWNDILVIRIVIKRTNKITKNTS